MRKIIDPSLKSNLDLVRLFDKSAGKSDTSNNLKKWLAPSLYSSATSGSKMASYKKEFYKNYYP